MLVTTQFVFVVLQIIENQRFRVPTIGAKEQGFMKYILLNQ